jgi:hypothetical protein
MTEKAKLPWTERVNMLSVNPDAATSDDVAQMAAEIQSQAEQIAALELSMCPLKGQLREARETALWTIAKQKMQQTIDKQSEQLKARDALLRRAKDTLEPYPTIGKLKAMQELMKQAKHVTPEEVDGMAHALDALDRKYGKLYEDIEQALKGDE